jgi:3-hydroxybutyryl-CoA dehydrogenase
MVEAGWLGRKTGRGWFRYGDDAEPSQPDAAPVRSAPSWVTEHGESPLRALLGRSGVEIRPGEGGPGTVELPGGALLARSDGRPATGLAADWGQPVVVVDRTLDDATAEGIAIAASDGCPAAARRPPGTRPPGCCRRPGWPCTWSTTPLAWS